MQITARKLFNLFSRNLHSVWRLVDSQMVPFEFQNYALRLVPAYSHSFIFNDTDYSNFFRSMFWKIFWTKFIRLYIDPCYPQSARVMCHAQILGNLRNANVPIFLSLVMFIHYPKFTMNKVDISNSFLNRYSPSYY